MKQKYNKDVHYICKLSGIRRIEKEYGKLKNYDVILTDERKKHILIRRGNDGDNVLSNLVKTIKGYDLILDAGSGCVRFIKMNEDNYSYVIKLSLNNSKEGNSIITGIRIKTRKVNKYILRNKIIDSRLWYYVYELWGRNNV